MMLFGTVFRPGIRDGWVPLHVTGLFGTLFYVIGILLIWTFIIKRIKAKKFTKRIEKRFLVIFFAILTVGQLLFLSQINLPMNAQCFINTNTAKICAWDWNYLAQGAANTVTGDQSGESGWSNTLAYLHVHQNNIPTFYLIKTVFQAASTIGITNFQLVGTMMNLIAINLSLLLIYLTARRLFGIKKAVFSLVISTAVLPMAFIYLPIFYTDTLSLPFPIAMIYLYTIYRDAKDKKKAFWLIPTIALVAFFGSMIKFSVLIVLIAIIVDMLIHTRKATLKRAALSLTTMAAIIAPLMFLYTHLAQIYVHDRAETKLITTPWTHYFMMGLGSSNGGQYSVTDDMATTTQPNVQEAITYNIAESKKRLAELGWNYPYFLYFKALGTWAEGTHESLYRIGNMNVKTEDYHPTAFQDLIVSSESAKPISLVSFMYAVNALLLAGLLIGGIKTYADSVQRKMLRWRGLLQLSVMGVAIFLLLWEANPRYIVNFMPLVILLTTPVFYSLAPRAIRQLKAGYLRVRSKTLKY